MTTIGSIITWIVFGIVAGLVARLLVPGQQPMGWIATMILGIVGSFAGGGITYLVRGGQPGDPAGFLMSIVGAVLVLMIYISMNKRSPA
ncbi:GlsB/YeaQ/YmgE family stress response membrane protein [Planctomicrobium sp. SH668]|uniref:GlsB/YeaQ/YmgE family stress response membrane protein n=1 Tax=Planctomicrobium sp. SH668 TaxID=3448126 RepID=UPI003F5BC829